MYKLFKKIIGDKKEWKAMEARAKTLPKDYRIVYHEIQQYIWKSSGQGSVEVFKGLLDLFEEGAINGRRALEITGNDVAKFCDELIGGGAKTYVDKWREKLNRDTKRKLGNDGEQQGIL